MRMRYVRVDLHVFSMNFVISILCCTCSMDVKAEPENIESDEDDIGHGVTAEPVYSDS